MKKTDLLKLACVVVLSTGLIAGCASDTQEAAPAPEPDVADTQTCTSAEAKNSIYSAKVKLARAEKLGYAWRDTAALIEEAEKEAAAGNCERAIELANQAAEQAEDAIAQYHAETKRYNEEQGSVETPEESTDSEYTVVSGDNLWNISGSNEVYGNPYQWPLIYKANSDQIKDADLIFPGQVFSVPSASSADEIDAAVQHAKTRGAWSVGTAEESDKDYLAQ
jgi:LysM repeat protein